VSTLNYLSNFIKLPQLKTFSTTRQSSLESVLEKEELTDLPLIQMEQLHGVEFAVITKSQAKTQTIPKVDALLTTVPNVILAARTADCIPVLIAHPSGLIGVAHCGMKGTEAGLLRNVLTHIRDKMKLTDKLQIWFGPAICQRCYVIDAEKELTFNLVRENFKQVLEIFPDDAANVSPANLCTFHQNEDFFSHRKEEKERNYSLISRSEFS